jgi:putative transposase
MPKSARLVVPEIPHHMTQRGNNRQRVFLDREDHLRYLAFMEESLTKYDVHLLGFCLMPNHVHQILIPHDKESLAAAMDQASSNYARSFNRRYRRCGHLWQSRFYSCPLSPSHLHRGLRYVELNPVRASMVQDAWDYEWSSAALHVGLVASQPGLTKQLQDPGLDIQDWKRYLQETESETDRIRIRNCTSKGIRWDD